MQPEQQQRIMGYFIEEAKDHLNTIERGLLNLQSTLTNPEMINEVFRAAHSVKGGAAMLGLNAIQHSAHRLEDYFKVLKETPGIQVDQRLESLLLKVFDTLQELVEQLQGPGGLTADAASVAMTEIKPVFEEIDQYLATLAADAADAQIVPVPVGYASEQFHARVAADLRAMLELFKQADTLSDVRSQLLTLSDRVQSHGESVGLVQWVNLMEPVKSALSNPDNDYRTLAAVIIKELKQAQDRVKLDQLDQIVPSESLLALLPLVAPTNLPELDADMVVDSDWPAASDAAIAELDALAVDLSNLDADIADIAEIYVTGDELDDLDLGGLDDGELDFDALLGGDTAMTADGTSGRDDLAISLDESSTASLDDLDQLFVGMDERELALMKELESPSNHDLSEAVTDMALDDDALNQAADALTDSFTGSLFMDQTVVEVPGDEWDARPTQELAQATSAERDGDSNSEAFDVSMVEDGDIDSVLDQPSLQHEAGDDLGNAESFDLNQLSDTNLDAMAEAAAADLAAAAGLTEDLNLPFESMENNADNHDGVALDDANAILADLATSDAADSADHTVAEPRVDVDESLIAGDISIAELSDAAISDLADLSLDDDVLGQNSADLGALSQSANLAINVDVSLDVDPWDDNPADLAGLSQSDAIATNLDDDLSQLLDDVDTTHPDLDLSELDDDDDLLVDAAVEADASGDGLDDLAVSVEFDAAAAGFDAELDSLLDEASDFAEEFADLNLSGAADFDLQTTVGNEDFSQSADFCSLMSCSRMNLRCQPEMMIWWRWPPILNLMISISSCSMIKIRHPSYYQRSPAARLRFPRHAAHRVVVRALAIRRCVFR